MIVDVNRNRALMVSLFGLRRVDERFTLFYEETNNLQQFYHTQGSTNVAEHKNLVLGGIALKEGQRLPELSPLRSAFKLSPSDGPLQLADVGRGDFEGLLASHRLGLLLAWLLEHDLLIHYTSINIINWSIIDIMDAILSQSGFGHFRVYQSPLKNELYRLVNLDKTRFLQLMRRHHYPDISPGDCSAFLGDLADWVNSHCVEGDDPPLLVLSELFKKAATLQSLPSFTPCDREVQVDDFKDFYIRSVSLFKNATHIFHDTPQIQQTIGHKQFRDNDLDVKVRFRSAAFEPGLQLAGLITGLVSRYHCFVEEHTLAELLNKKGTWTERQLAYFDMLRELIDRSEEASNALIFRSTTQDSEWRNDTFMHNFPAAHLDL